MSPYFKVSPNGCVRLGFESEKADTVLRESDVELVAQMDTLTKSDRAALVAMIDERDRKLRQNKIDKAYQAGLDKGKDENRGLEGGAAFVI